MIEYPDLIKSHQICLYKRLQKKRIKIFDGRKIFKYKTHYRKIIDHQNYRFGKGVRGFGGGMTVHEHVKLVNKFFPGYILDYKVFDNYMWIDYKIIKGIPASEIYPKTPEFIKKVYRFCINNMRETAPYYHYDMHLGNIMVDGDNLKLIDWDSLDIYTEQEVFKKIFRYIIMKNLLYPDLEIKYSDTYTVENNLNL